MLLNKREAENALQKKYMEDVKMNETELEKYEYADYEGVSESDIFLKDHYEKLFYMTPKELAIEINAMNEDELIQFNQTIHKGHGMNVDLRYINWMKSVNTRI